MASNMEAPSDDGMVLNNNDLLEAALDGGVGLRLGEREGKGEEGEGEAVVEEATGVAG